mmetsp:Transcript_43492/g.99673  ORF Transcript_43492/g.99673 Transcript_43492/m.99673 type:complete len:324 (-) Transcript_43492:265-1236(-)
MTGSNTDVESLVSTEVRAVELAAHTKLSTRGTTDPISNAERTARSCVVCTTLSAERALCSLLVAGSIPETTSGTAWPKQSMLRKTGTAHVEPTPFAGSSIPHFAVIKELLTGPEPTAAATKAANPTRRASDSHVLARSTVRCGAEKAKIPAAADGMAHARKGDRGSFRASISPAFTTCAVTTASIWVRNATEHAPEILPPNARLVRDTTPKTVDRPPLLSEWICRSTLLPASAYAIAVSRRKPHTQVSATSAGRNPIGVVTMGNASIPPPIAVPAIMADASLSSIGGSECCAVGGVAITAGCSGVGRRPSVASAMRTVQRTRR